MPRRNRGGLWSTGHPIEQLNGVTQQVAANAEESASASEELASQAVMLTELVGTFNLGSSGGVSTAGAVAAPSAARKRNKRPMQYMANV